MFIKQVFPYMPRLFGVVTLLLFTWLAALLARYVVVNSWSVSESSRGTRVGTLAYVGVFVLMSPFLLSAAGAHAEWLFFSQSLIASVAQAWPLWFGLSLMLGGILYIVRAAPKVIATFMAARKSSIG